MPEPRTLTLPSGGGKPDFKPGTIFFVGTATVIIRYAGWTILTDPNFLHKGEQIRLGYGLRSRRITDPALDIEALPPLDLVLLSHYHEDHFDRVAERRLDHGLPLVTTPHAAAVLKHKGFRATQPLKTWESLEVAKGNTRLRITSMPGEHAPGLLSKLLPPVMGSLLEFESSPGNTALRMYITGDTLMYDQLREIPARYPDIDLALLHLGGTRVLGLMVTMDAKQGVEAIKLIDPTIAIPIHYNDYPVFKSPLEDFQREVQAAGLEHLVRYLRHGETYAFKVPRSRIR